MPRCDCGCDFGRGCLDGEILESYAVIHDADYQRVMQDERAIQSQKSQKRRLELIADSSTRVGSLVACPRCGAFLLAKPQREGKDVEMTLLKKSAIHIISGPT